MNVENLASICHEANRMYCNVNADFSQMLWEIAPDWQKQSCIKGVEFHINNPDASAGDSHRAWLAHKVSEGWIYGEYKDIHLKTHPCMVPFEELPIEEQLKDHLFKAIVDVFRDHLE